MFDTTRDKAYGCIEDDSCGSYANTLFFMLFILVATYMMLNLFILVLMQNFEMYYINKDNALESYQENSNRFKKMWMKFCYPENINFISQKNLVNLHIVL
jgi:hypothetical protein